MEEAIKLFKYQGKIGISRGLTKIMRIYLDYHRFSLPELDFVIPVPLHRRKLKERGFNQAEIIAKFIASYLNLPLVRDGLIRVRFTNSQTQLKRKERLINVKGAFKVKRGERFKGKRVLLVDDVYTTGVTLNEVAREIKKTKAEVYVSALARTP
ncbi:ComF family protein [Patescibacteria group bacterium]|nr:ComF family protein [Patescibacteria group bacterium]